MGGKMSRNKGSRAEYLVRDELRKLGYTADRVPMSGAAQGFKGDVRASKDGKDVLFEVKSRKDEYKSIYALLDSYPQEKRAGVGIHHEDLKQFLAFGYSLEAVLAVDHYMVIPASKASRKLFNLEKLLGTAEILVIKINNKPLIYIQYLKG